MEEHTNEKPARKGLSPRTKQMIRLLLRILFIVVIVAIFYAGAFFAYRFGYSIFEKNTPGSEPGNDITVTITPDMTAQDVAELFLENGIITDEKVFRIQELLYTSKRKPIYPGTYVLNDSWPIEEIFRVITEEPEVTEETTALAVAPGGGNPSQIAESSSEAESEQVPETTSDR